MLTIFATTACAGKDAAASGTLTVTNIQAHNGPLAEDSYIYGFAYVENGDKLLYLGADEPSLEDYLLAAIITDGSASLKVYETTNTGTGRMVYTGNDAVDILELYIVDSDAGGVDGETSNPDRMYINTASVKFKNGSAEVNFAYVMIENK